MFGSPTELVWGVYTEPTIHSEYINNKQTQKTMKTNIHKSAGFTLVELLVVIAIIVTLAGVATPVLLGQKKKGDHAKAVQNAKQVGYALFNFENDFGRYPDTNTLDDLDDGAIVAAGTSTSNAFFSQLIAAGYVDQEAPFFAKTAFTVEPDNIKNTASTILDEGEVGFSYVMRSSGVALNSSVNSAIPLVVAPASLDSAGDFDRNVYNKKAVVLRIDMSVTDPRINDQNRITLRGGNDLINSTSAGTVWNDSGITSPVVVVPAGAAGG